MELKGKHRQVAAEAVIAWKQGPCTVVFQPGVELPRHMLGCEPMFVFQLGLIWEVSSRQGDPSALLMLPNIGQSTKNKKNEMVKNINV